MLGGAAAFLGQNSFSKKSNAYTKRLSVKPNFVFRNAVDKFVRRGERVGWLADHTAIYLFCAAGENDCVINLCGTSFSSGSINGGRIFTPYAGVTFDGVDGWINPNIAWASIVDGSLTQHGAWAYLFADRSTGTSVFGSSGGGNSILIQPRNGTNARVFDGASAESSDPVPATTAAGFIGFFRNNGTDYVINKRGAETTKTRNAPTAWPSTGPGIARVGTSGATFDTSQVSMIGVLGGSGTLNNAAMRLDLAAACDELALSIGFITDDILNPVPAAISFPATFDATGPLSISAVTPAGLRVMQQGPPPTATQTKANFSLFPGSDFGTTQFVKLVSGNNTTVNGHGWQWAMRRNTPYTIMQGNPIFAAGFQVNDGGVLKNPTMEFSTLAYADACTYAHLAYHVGKSAHEGDGSGYLDYLNAAGLTDDKWIPFATASSSPGTYFTHAPTNGNPAQKASLDLVIAPVARMDDATRANLKQGIVLDFEVADGRTAAECQAYLTQCAAIIKGAGKEAVLYTNPLNTGNAAKEGYSDPATLAVAAAEWDFISIVVWHRSPEKDFRQAFINQADMLPSGFDYAKLMLVVGMGDMTDTEAVAMRAIIDGSDPYMAGRKPGMVNIWRAYGVPTVLSYDTHLATLLGLPYP